MLKDIRKYENFHIVLWLVKDFCWCADVKWLGMVIAIPTIIISLHITYLSRFQIAELVHNAAVSCWIMANIIWMTGEFFFNDGLRPPALVFFVLGMLIVAWYYGRMLVAKVL